MKEPISRAEAVALIPDGATLMIGGFMGVGTPDRLLQELVQCGPPKPVPLFNESGKLVPTSHRWGHHHQSPASAGLFLWWLRQRSRPEHGPIAGDRCNVFRQRGARDGVSFVNNLPSNAAVPGAVIP